MSVPSSTARDNHDLPPVTNGFEHINRYWDPHAECFAAKIFPGQYYVTTKGEMVVTTLGSCVSACIRDRVFGVGGMNHFMLPNDYRSSPSIGELASMDDAARYGVYAMELLINAILINGGKRENLEVKITGGGRMVTNMLDIGKRNIDFVRRFLATERIHIEAEEVGDIYPRKVYYFPVSGKVRVKKLRNMHNATLTNLEQEYMQELRRKTGSGGIELF